MVINFIRKVEKFYWLVLNFNEGRNASFWIFFNNLTWACCFWVLIYMFVISDYSSFTLNFLAKLKYSILSFAVWLLSCIFSKDLQRLSIFWFFSFNSLIQSFSGNLRGKQILLRKTWVFWNYLFCLLKT